MSNEEYIANLRAVIEQLENMVHAREKTIRLFRAVLVAWEAHYYKPYAYRPPLAQHYLALGEITREEILKWASNVSPPANGPAMTAALAAAGK